MDTLKTYLAKTAPNIELKESENRVKW